MIKAVESTVKSLEKINTGLNRNATKLANTTLKVDIEETPKKKTKWRFTILRDQKGLIKNVEAQEL